LSQIAISWASFFLGNGPIIYLPAVKISGESNLGDPKSRDSIRAEEENGDLDDTELGNFLLEILSDDDSLEIDASF
jgi:hypothetical protein